MTKMRGKIPDSCDRLSAAFQRLVPLQPASPKGRKRATENEIRATSERALQQFFAAARDERLRQNFGVIAKARVAFGLQQRLIKLGYPPALVKQVLFSMLTSAFVGDQK